MQATHKRTPILTVIGLTADDLKALADGAYLTSGNDHQSIVVLAGKDHDETGARMKKIMALADKIKTLADKIKAGAELHEI